MRQVFLISSNNEGQKGGLQGGAGSRSGRSTCINMGRAAFSLDAQTLGPENLHPRCVRFELLVSRGYTVTSHQEPAA
jgi:hypothetical protein